MWIYFVRRQRNQILVQHLQKEVISMADFKIVSRSSGKVLDVPGFATHDGAQIQQFTDNGGKNQHWGLIPIGGGFFKIVSRSSGKVLDVPGSATNDGEKIQQFTDNGGTNQQWRLMKAG